MKKKRLHFVLWVCWLATACHSIKVHSSHQFAAAYDVKAHRSRYSDPPFADVILPGKWWKARNTKGAESTAPIFYNEDSTFVWLDRYPRQQFNFNLTAMDDSAFLQAYFAAIVKNWSRQGLDAVSVFQNSTQHYVICRTQPEDPCCTMHLIGYHRKVAYLISVTGTLEEAEKANLLESLFILN